MYDDPRYREEMHAARGSRSRLRPGRGREYEERGDYGRERQWRGAQFESPYGESGRYGDEGYYGTGYREDEEERSSGAGGYREPEYGYEREYGPRGRVQTYGGRGGEPARVRYFSDEDEDERSSFGRARGIQEYGARGYSQADFRGRGPRGYRRSDERIREDVCEALTESREVDAGEFEVEVTKGIVVLRGAVDDRRQKRLAEDLAERARGVRDVRNELEVQRGLVDDLTNRVGGGRRQTDDVWRYRDESWRGADLRGFTVEAEDGSIGSIDDLTQPGAGFVVVDTGPWIFGRKVMLPASVIERVDFDDRRVFVSRSRDEIKDAPEFDEAIYESSEYRDRLGAYYRERRRERA